MESNKINHKVELDEIYCKGKDCYKIMKIGSGYIKLQKQNDRVCPIFETTVEKLFSSGYVKKE